MDGKFTVINNDGTLEITLEGGLDAGNSGSLSDQLQEYKEKDIKKIVFFAKDLSYLASAGIRVIIFAIQKILKPGSDTYLIGAQADVINVFEMTGLDDAFIIQEDYES